jgi:hypothetical protein
MASKPSRRAVYRVLKECGLPLKTDKASGFMVKPYKNNTMMVHWRPQEALQVA